MTKPSFFTLLLAVAISQLLVSSVPGVNALQGMNLAPPPVVRRAEHAEINQRMLKKRRPQADVPINPAADVPAASSTTTPAQTSTPQAATTRTTTSAAQTTSNGGLIGDLSSIVNNLTSKTSTTLSASSTPASTSTPPQTTSAPATTSTPHTTTNRNGSVVYVTASATDAASTTDNSQNQDSSFLPHSVIIGLIVTGSCIAAGAAIWTIIRKWKFSPSRHFEDRLEPINWEPKQGSGIEHDPTAAALARAGSRNGTRPSSYISGDEHGNGSVRNMASTQHEAISMAPDFPPAHDFTAGAAGAGYVDMHRGPSPAPGQYGGAYGGHYETPNPYDAYDYNGGYGQRRY